MAPPTQKGPTLSVGFLQHLGIETNDARGGRGGRGGKNTIQPRKEQRRDVRSKQHGSSYTYAREEIEARASSVRRSRKAPLGTRKSHAGEKSSLLSKRSKMGQHEEDEEERDDFDASLLSNEEPDEGNDWEESSVSDSRESAGASEKVSRRVREKLEQDDAEIAELERKLGVKGRKSLPKSFTEDGLGDLLGPLGSSERESAETLEKKKRKAEAEEWLRSKRRKALPSGVDDDTEEEEEEGYIEEGDGDDAGEDSITGSRSDGSGGFETSSLKEHNDSDSYKDRGARNQSQKRQRENPYVAPVPATTSPQKYVPPALRRVQQGSDTESEAVLRVRRQVHHLIARLSDANMLTILGEVEKLYLDHPRQHVTNAVVEKLLEQAQVEGALSSNVITMLAGFAAAVYMVQGTDFGARFIQTNATRFRQQYDILEKADDAATSRERHRVWAPSSKIALNLFALMAELYNFRMIGPNLIFDYIRLLLRNLTEINTELLLRVFETSGHRLRQDEPRALKEIVSLIQPAVARAGGEKSLSARTRHMIDKINDLKKSEKKKHRDAESSGYGHAERIRKMLGSLPTSRKLEAAGPLRVSLADIEQTDERGKWWLVGASWTGRGEASVGAGESNGGAYSGITGDGLVKAASGGETASQQDGRSQAGDGILGSWGDNIPDVEELDLLAREQGMNTDARRSVFVTLLSSADSKDAHARLLRLGLNKYEKREIANVLVRCVGSEKQYNRFYGVVARQVCNADRRMSWVFQACLWKLFRRMGEPMFGEALDEDDVGDEEDEATDLRRIVNTAKMFGYLIASGSLSLRTLKCLSLIRLQSKTRVFVEVLLVALFEEARKAGKAGGKDGKAGNSTSNIIRKRFGMVRDNEDLRRGLQYFLGRVVRKSRLVAKEQRSSIAKECDRAQNALGGDGSEA